jgi:hypothetical protein
MLTFWKVDRAGGVVLLLFDPGVLEPDGSPEEASEEDLDAK